MDSDWALLEFRPGRYVKVTATGEVLGKPSDEEVRSWFASRGWSVESTPGSLSLDLETEAEPSLDVAQIVVEPLPTEARAPDGALPPSHVATDVSKPTGAQVPRSDMHSLSPDAEDVPVIVPPEPGAPTQVVPIDAPETLPTHTSDSDELRGLLEPTAHVSAPDAPDALHMERPREQTDASTVGAGVEPELPELDSDPTLADTLVLPEKTGKGAPNASLGPLMAVAPSVARHDPAPPPQPESTAAKRVTQPPPAASVPDATAGAEGVGRWLWVDPRQESGYSPAGFDVAAFLGRAVELFGDKPWAGGMIPSRVALHPDNVTEELESAAEALGLEVLGDARVMVGTYMLGMGDGNPGD